MKIAAITRLALIGSAFGCLGALSACTSAANGVPTVTATASPVPATAQPTMTPKPTATSIPSATPTPACVGESGQVERTSYHSRQLGRDIPLAVYLPPCYQQTAPEGYPAAYLLHGKPYDEEHWLSLGVVDAFELGWRQGRWPAAVLVMPDVPEPLFSSTDGGPNSYESEMLDSLIPYIESTYRVEGEPAGRSIGGISRGGVWSLEIGLSHRDLFAAVAALSPALAVNHPRPAYDPFQLVEAQSGGGAQFLLLAGEDDWAWPETARLADQMQAAGWQTQLRLVSGNHSDPTWQATMADVIEFLLGPFDG